MKRTVHNFTGINIEFLIIQNRYQLRYLSNILDALIFMERVKGLASLNFHVPYRSNSMKNYRFAHIQ